MLPKTLFKFYAEIFCEKKIGLISFYFFRILYKTSEYVLPAFLVKYLVRALEAKPLGLLTFSDVMPVLCGLSAWIVLYVFSEIAESSIRINVFPDTKKLVHIKIFRYLIDKSVAFYKNHSAGYLNSQAKFIINNTSPLLFKYPTLLFSILLGIFLNLGFLFKLNWVFFAIVLLCLGMRIIYSLMCCKDLSESYASVAKSDSEVSGNNIDILSNFLNLKIFGNAEKEQKYIGEYFDTWVSEKRKTLKLQLNFFVLPMITEFLSLIFILFLMTNFYIAGQMNLSEIAFVLTAFFSLRSCVVSLVWEIPDFLDYYYSAKQAFEKLTGQSANICDVQTGNKICSYDSLIKFNNVSFKYEQGWVLKNINLCINKGEKIGVVGPSGSGKTTLVNLLMHLYDPTCGNVEIDNVDIRDFDQGSLKKTMSFVPQESILFNRTLADNISYGVDKVTKKQIIEAAKQAKAHEFIENTENGYETIVGDRGVKISGGQRQRITIAHAILKNSPILLLDEATSALDSETEMKIQLSLNKLMKNRTTIAIAHRLSTLKQMDRIIVMDKGRIVETGTHDQLLKKTGGIYARLWNMQSGGFIRSSHTIV